MTDPQLLDRLRELWNRPPEPEPDREPFNPFDATDDDDGKQKPLDWCRRYGHRRAWRSIYGPHLICATCHTPAFDFVVAEWIDASNNDLQSFQKETLVDTIGRD